MLEYSHVRVLPCERIYVRVLPCGRIYVRVLQYRRIYVRVLPCEGKFLMCQEMPGTIYWQPEMYVDSMSWSPGVGQVHGDTVFFCKGRSGHKTFICIEVFIFLINNNIMFPCYVRVVQIKNVVIDIFPCPSGPMNYSETRNQRLIHDT